MTLSLIVAPPNSGRAGAVLDAFRDALSRDPILVVPTADDAERFERELAEKGPLLGGSVVTFGGLFGEVARAHELPWGPAMSRAQRTWLARTATGRVKPEELSGSASRPGFAPALADLIDELESAGIDPTTFTELAAGAGEYERDLARLYKAWTELRDELGLSDRHAMARKVTAAVRADGEGGRRPVFLYGFDDLTREQLELVGALAGTSEVTAAVAYEDREALKARAELLEDLRGLLPPEKLGAESELAPDPKTTPNKTLWHLQRGFLEAGADRVEPDDGLLLMRAAGEHAEAELVGIEIARLLAGGTEPDQIAIVLRSPGRSGALWAEILAGMGIPVAVEASVGLSATAIGRGLTALAKLAGPDGTAEDLVAYLRVPGRAPSGLVDRLERTVTREGMRRAAESEAAWGRMEKARDLFELTDVREAGSGATLLGTVARLARTVAEFPIADRAEIPGPRRALELRAASETADALLEIAELEPADLGPAELEEILGTVRFRLHQGAVRGQVRIVSPYRLRARRVEHLFVASLQDGEFPRRDPGSPLLPDERRRDLGLPERSSPEDEERYLFAVCLSRPEIGLGLSWRDTDAEGHPAARSPFIDEVRDLLAPEQPDDPEDPDPLLEVVGRERGPDAVVLEQHQASSDRELARSLASRGRESWRSALEAVEVPEGAAQEVEAWLGEAFDVTADDRIRPRDLRSEAVLAALGENDLFGASTLEGYAVCSYRWLVGHELRPQRLDPTDEPLVLGGLAHAALEQLYKARPGGTPRPTAATLPDWRRRAGELVKAEAEDSDLPSSDPLALAQIRRVEGLIASFLADEAAAERVLEPDAELLEAGFGEEPQHQRPPLELEGLRLHGSIDRVDVSGENGGRVGLVSDYKLSREVTAFKDLEEEGKLQLQLYSLALRRLWGIEPAGGVYLPLRGTDSRRPRGLLNGALSDSLEGFKPFSNDVLVAEEFEAALERAAARASAIAAAITRGRVRRDPPNNECPAYCRWQTICRRERGMGEPEDALEDEEETQ